MTTATGSLKQHDAALGPVASRFPAKAPAEHVARALLTAGLGAAHLSPSRVAAWTSSRLAATRPGVVAVLTDPVTRARLVRDARDYIREHSSPVGRQRLRESRARLGVAHLLSPAAGGGAGAVVAARVATAVVALEVLGRLAEDGDGVDRPRVHATKLAAVTGRSVASAAGALTRATEERWLMRDQPSRGVTPRYWLRGQLDTDQRAIADDHYALIQDLADGSDQTAAACVIRSVAHPAWSFAPQLGHRHWLVLLADEVDVAVTALGVPDRTARACRRDLQTLGVAAGPDLDVALDRIAATPLEGGWTTPRMLAEEAERKRRAAAATRAESVARARAAQAAAREQAQTERTADRQRARADRAAQRTAARTTGPVDQHAAGRTGTRTAVALPGWWTTDGPDLDRLRAELARARPDLVLVEILDGRAVVEALPSA